MRIRRLGRTGYEVSEIGFGAWGLGGAMWLGGTDEESRGAVGLALDSGVNFFDTALVYGDGHSERLLAEVIGRAPERQGVVVATKVPPRDHVWPGRAETPLGKTFPAKHVVSCVEQSLRNLGVEALQIEQLHVWHDAWVEAPEWPELRGAMQRLKEQGKVLHWGVSVNDHAPRTALKLAVDPLIETVQVIYNIYDRSPEAHLFDLAKRKDLGAIVRVPLDEGALSGAIGSDTQFLKGDWREEYFKGDRKAQAADRARSLEGLLGQEASTLPELALRFCLSRAEVATVIPGMRTAAHVRCNAAVSDGRPLSSAMKERLRAHAWDKNWYE